MVRRLNLRSPADAIGHQIKINGVTAPIVGVVKDFYNNSLHSEISSIAIFPSISTYSTCAVKIDPAHLHSNLAAIEKIWDQTFPDYLYSTNSSMTVSPNSTRPTSPCSG